MKNYKLDLFEILRRIDSGDINYFNNLSEAEMKEISPVVLMRWMSCCTKDKNNLDQVLYLNDLVNKLVFNFYYHKDLLIRMLMICSNKRNKKYEWLSKQAGKNHKHAISVLRERFGYSSREATGVLHLFNKDDMLEMASDLGWQKKEIDDLKTELKKATT